MKISDLKNSPMHCIFTGNAGTWKTTLAASFPKPFILDVDKGVKVLKGLPWAPSVEFEQPKTLVEVEQLLRSLNKRDDIETIIIDSATALEDMALTHFASINGHVDQYGDVTKQIGILEYGQRTRWFKSLITKLLNAGVHTILITHEEMIREQEHKVSSDKKNSEALAGPIKIQPAVPGTKLPSQLPGLADEVYRFTRMPGKEPRVKIQLDGNPKFDAKSRSKGELFLPSTLELKWGESLWEKLHSFKGK